jgi:hypothetical protein
MAKRSKKARKSKPAGAPEGRKRGSGRADPGAAADPDDGDPVDGDPEDGDPDPLSLQPWSTRTCSPAETEERVRFERAWEAFRRGDFHACRGLAAVLVAEAESSEVRQRAQALEARLRVDPWALGMAAVALSLLLTAVIWTFA